MGMKRLADKYFHSFCYTILSPSNLKSEKKNNKIISIVTKVDWITKNIDGAITTMVGVHEGGNLSISPLGVTSHASTCPLEMQDCERDDACDGAWIPNSC